MLVKGALGMQEKFTFTSSPLNILVPKEHQPSMTKSWQEGMCLIDSCVILSEDISSMRIFYNEFPEVFSKTRSRPRFTKI